MRALGLMPFLFFCGVAIHLRLRSNERGYLQNWREAAIVSGIATAVWVAAGCELLGWFRAVAFWPLLFWWALPIVLLIWKCRTWRPRLVQFGGDWLLAGIACATALVLALIFIQAFATPPNNWDALSYHLPRQVHWMQQRHVGLFATNDPRMVLMQPLAEYMGLHLMILSGGDRWVNVVQWFALALTAITASAIARELGCNHRLQALAALLVVTLPIAALEAANPKNDIVTAFYLCALAYAGLKAYNTKKFSAPLTGAALGLLLLSKGTGAIFGLPIVLWIAAVCVRASGLKRPLIWGLAVGLIALSINAPFLVRLTVAFGSPMGPPVGDGSPAVANTLFTPRAFVSNVVRNTAMHLATGAEKLDAAATRAVATVHEWLGLDIDDPRTTFSRTAPFAVKLNLADEDRAKAPVHMALAIAAFAMGIANLFRRGDKWVAAFALVPFVSFAVFSFLTAWQEWHSRLHIPALCLLAPVVVHVLRSKVLPFGALALALGLICVVQNEAKPLFRLKRASARFKDEQTIKGLEEAKRAVREKRPAVLGIAARPNRCEYFLLSTLLEVQKPAPHFVKVNNRFPHIEPAHPNPDLVISWYRPPGLTNADFRASYALTSESGAAGVFGRK